LIGSLSEDQWKKAFRLLESRYAVGGGNAAKRLAAARTCRRRFRIRVWLKPWMRRRPSSPSAT
jgi:hypothetical protein